MLIAQAAIMILIMRIHAARGYSHSNEHGKWIKSPATRQNAFHNVDSLKIVVLINVFQPR
jgi:hypothetical protein